MTKLRSNFKNMVVVLSTITLFASLILASVYMLTKEPIAYSKTLKQRNAIKEVLPLFDHLDPKPIEVMDGVESIKVFKAYDKKHSIIGAAVQTSSNNGYNGHIDIMVGFDKAGVIVNYTILQQHETPGLGGKMVNWFKTNYKKQSIIGKDPATANLSVSKNGGEVDAITGATISSKAFLFAVRNAYFAYSTFIVAQEKVKPEVEDFFSTPNDDSSLLIDDVKKKEQTNE